MFFPFQILSLASRNYPLSMRLFAFLPLFLIALYAQGQASFVEYYTKNNKKTTKVEEAHYSRLIALDENRHVVVKDTYLSSNQGKLLGTYKSLKERVFVGQKIQGYENGNLKSKEYYSQDGKLIDTAFYYYPSGKLKIVFQYPYTVEKKKTQVTDTLILIFKDSLGNTLLKDGNGYAELENPYKNINIRNSVEKGNLENHKRTGEWTGTFLKGKYTFTEYYDKGKLLHGTTIDASGKETSYDASTFLRQPEHPRGMNSFRIEVAESFKYPQEAVNEKVEGAILIKYVVNEKGKITNPRVVKDLGYGTREAAMEAFRQASNKDWIPGMIRGVPVSVEYSLPVRISMNTDWR